MPDFGPFERHVEAFINSDRSVRVGRVELAIGAFPSNACYPEEERKRYLEVKAWDSVGRRSASGWILHGDKAELLRQLRQTDVAEALTRLIHRISHRFTEA